MHASATRSTLIICNFIIFIKDCTPVSCRVRETRRIFNSLLGGNEGKGLSLCQYSRLLVSEMTRKEALPVLSLLRLLIFCAAIFERNAVASVEINESATGKKGIEGCVECGDYRWLLKLEICLFKCILLPFCVLTYRGCSKRSGPSLNILNHKVSLKARIFPIKHFRTFFICLISVTRTLSLVPCIYIYIYIIHEHG